MNLCTFSNITVFVPSEKESLPYKRSDSEGVWYCETEFKSSIRWTW